MCVRIEAQPPSRVLDYMRAMPVYSKKCFVTQVGCDYVLFRIMYSYFAGTDSSIGAVDSEQEQA